MYKKYLLLLLLVLIFSGCRKEEPEDTVLLTIDEEEVHIEEGRLYLELAKQAFEETGGEEIWDMSLSGRDAMQTAGEKALESLIRTKILSRQMPESQLTEEDRQKIDQSTEKLLQELGDDGPAKRGISEDQLYTCMEESYRAWLYRQSLIFLPGTQEDELEYQTAEAFVRYDMVDQQTYLQRVELDVIMVYTGEWIDDSWIAYPDSQQQEKQEQIEEAQRLLMAGASFDQVRGIYSEDESLQDNRLLHDGVVQADIEETSVLYRGQIQADLAEKIFRTPAGEYTDILSTRYGFMIVWVKGYADAAPEAYEVYRQQLAQAREEYRVTLMQELSEIQFEEEYERLKTEVEVVINEEMWKDAVNGQEEPAA